MNIGSPIRKSLIDRLLRARVAAENDSAAWEALLVEARQRLQQPGADSKEWFENLASLVMELPPAQIPVHGIEILLTACNHFYVAQKFPLGTFVANAAITAATQRGEAALERRACNILGVLEMELGNYLAAMQSLARSVDVARRIGDLNGECSTMANMASCMHSTRQYDLAIQSARRVRAMSVGNSKLNQERFQASQIIADCFFRKAQYEDALQAIEDAITETPAPVTQFDHTQMVRTYHLSTQIHMKLGQLTSAVMHLNRAQQSAAIAQSGDCNLYVVIDQLSLDVAAAKALAKDSHCDWESTQQTLLQRTDAVAGKIRLLRRASPAWSDAMYGLAEIFRELGSPERAEACLRNVFAQFQEAKLESFRRQFEELSARLAVSDKTHEEIHAQKRNRLEQMAVEAEMHDDATGKHAYRVGRLSALIGHQLGLMNSHCDAIEIAARMHDIGKIAIPESILLYPHALEGERLAIMRTHSEHGERMLVEADQGDNHPLFKMAAAIARSHHERWDGFGYPDKIPGQHIPLEARITSVADVFDALSHARPYKKAWSLHATLLHMHQASGSHFDPQIYEAFRAVIEVLVARHGEENLDAALENGATPFMPQALNDFVIGPGVRSV